MTSGSVLPLNVTVNVTSSLESQAFATPQLPYDISITVTTSSLVTIPFINVGATSSVGTNVVVSALNPYIVAVGATSSAGPTIVPSNVLPYTVAINATSSYNTFVVSSSIGTPAIEVVTTTLPNAVTASVAYQAYTASYLLGSIQSASYAATASVLYGSIQSASFAANAISSSYALTASYAQNVPTLAWTNLTGIPIGIVTSSVQINTGSFSGSITSASYAQTASFSFTSSYAATASIALSNKDIELVVCTNQPANTVIKAISSQLSEPDSSDRFQFDLSTYSQYRITTAIIRAGPSGSKLGVQYSTDQINWNYLDTLSGSLVSTMATGIRTTNWSNLDVSTHTDVFIRWVAVNGDDTSDTTFRYISIGVR